MSALRIALFACVLAACRDGSYLSYDWNDRDMLCSFSVDNLTVKPPTILLEDEIEYAADQRRVVLVHALPNAIAPTIQVIGLNFLYLAGGVVIVEFVFNFPGIGQGLVDAVNDRDIPVIQFIVLVLAAFYVVMNIVTDVIALLATPRRRIAR